MAITHGTTYGGGQLARIYDRLRKRSQRARCWNGAAPVGGPSSYWGEYDHLAYVAGVRDALNAVETDGLTLADQFDLGAA